MDILIAIIGGGVGAAVVSVIGSLILAKQNRKYQKEDKESADMTALKAGMKWLMYDRIRFLGLHYIESGTVDFDDRRLLREMHHVYHFGLEGNGDLDNIMQLVDKLPLTQEVRKNETV